MARINVLDKQTAELIAAGEVIERPSSIIKELVENAIDAGASAITVEIQNGGIRYLRVTDNGCGILREDVPKAFLRHATSKVSSQEDLYQIGTLGFRGEALASIAAVGRVELLTRTVEEDLGTRYTIAGSEPQNCEDAGCPTGTTIVVRDIFYNIPARMKFLKKDVTEGNAIAALLDRLALSHPEVSLKLIREGQLKLHTPGDGKLLSAIYAVYGSDFGGSLIPVQSTLAGIRVEGFVTKPEKAKASRSMEHFFINGRYIRSGTMLSALEEAYRNSIMVGKFPGCVLNVILPFGMVDVNVHPAKLEVKLSDEKLLFDAVYQSVKGALTQLDHVTSAMDTGRVYTAKMGISAAQLAQKPLEGNQLRMSAHEYRTFQQQEKKPEKVAQPVDIYTVKQKDITGKPNAWAGNSNSDIASKYTSHVKDLTVASSAASGLLEDNSARLLYRSSLIQSMKPQDDAHPEPLVKKDEVTPQKATDIDSSILKQAPVDTEKKILAKDTPAATPSEEPIPPMRLIGEVFKTYILAEQGTELLLIDKHAAHERILFEKLKEAHKTNGDIPRQTLLAPMRISFSKDRYDCLLQNISLLSKTGFALEDFGDGSILVREIPTVMGMSEVEDMLEEAIDKLQKGNKHLDLTIYDELFHSIACKAAVKGGSFTGLEEREELICLLQQNRNIRNCPHGRPVIVSMKKQELERMFGRII